MEQRGRKVTWSLVSGHNVSHWSLTETEIVQVVGTGTRRDGACSVSGGSRRRGRQAGEDPIRLIKQPGYLGPSQIIRESD